MRLRFACLAICCVFFMSQPALSADDAISVAQKVISDQLAALVAKDARTAYSLASPDIRSKFTDENRFIEMVKKNYGPLSSSSRYAFGRSKIMAEGDVVLQEVTISGRDGKDWTAVYEVRHQGDGSYKINGVRMLAKSTSQGI